MLAHDRLNRVDVIGDQLRRHAVEIRRMFDDAAEAFGAGTSEGIAEGCGITLDVVRGRNSSSRATAVKSVLENSRVGRGKAVALDRHPFGEFVGEPASAFSARATGSSKFFSSTSRITLREDLAA